MENQPNKEGNIGPDVYCPYIILDSISLCVVSEPDVVGLLSVKGASIGVSPS